MHLTDFIMCLLCITQGTGHGAYNNSISYTGFIYNCQVVILCSEKSAFLIYTAFSQIAGATGLVFGLKFRQSQKYLDEAGPETKESLPSASTQVSPARLRF